MTTYINTTCRSLNPLIPYVGVVEADSPELAASILFQKNLAYGIMDCPKPEDMLPLGNNVAMIASGGDSFGYVHRSRRDHPSVKDYDMDGLFENVQYWVEATHEEQYYIWVNYSEESDTISQHRKVDFIASGYGVGFYTPPINGTNIQTCVSVRPFLLNGVLCAFYEPTSQTVAWKMVEQMIENKAKHYKDRHCNVANFHSCIHFTEKESQRKGQ